MKSKENNPPNEIKVNCKYCIEKIDQKAKVCYHCGKYQKKFFNNIFSVNALTTIISICLLVLSFFQYRDSSIEKANAIEASEASKLALGKITEIEKRISNDGEYISNSIKSLGSISEILSRPPQWEGLSRATTDSLNLFFKILNKNYSEYRKNKLKESIKNK